MKHNSNISVVDLKKNRNLRQISTYFQAKLKKNMDLMRISNFFLEELKKYINFRQNSDTCLQNLKKNTIKAQFQHFLGVTEKVGVVVKALRY